MKANALLNYSRNKQKRYRYDLLVFIIDEYGLMTAFSLES